LHAPQLPSEVKSTSHPSEAIPLQSANPGLHGPITHNPLLQRAPALANEHTLLHFPQLLIDDVMLISHPSTT